MMVKQLVDAVKRNTDLASWVAKFGVGTALAIYFTIFVCQQFSKLTDHTMTVSVDATSAVKEISVASQKIADNTDSSKEIARAVLGSVKERGLEHDRLLDALPKFEKRIDSQDAKLDAMLDGCKSLSEGLKTANEGLRQSMATQNKILERLETKAVK